MAKSAWVVLALLAALAALPLVAAHGAIPPREIDTRVVLDANSLQILDYGAANGLYEDGAGRDARLPAIPFYEGGHDLMTLDLREGYGPDGNGTWVPGLYAQEIFRRGDPGEAGIRDIITFLADGAERSLDLATADNVAYTSTTFTWVSERREVGGYEFGVEGFAPYAVLGVSPGATLSELQVTSFVGDAATDVMAGTYYYQGQYLPGEAQGPDVGNGPRAYTLAGPAALFTATPTATALDLTQPTVNVAVDLATALSVMAQIVTVSVDAPEGLMVTADRSEFKLDNATATGQLQLSIMAHGAIPPSNLTLTFRSDLGAAQVVSWPISVEVPVPMPTDHVGMMAGQEGATEGMDHGVHDHAEANAPGPGFAMLVLSLVVVALLARRRA